MVVELSVQASQILAIVVVCTNDVLAIAYCLNAVECRSECQARPTVATIAMDEESTCLMLDDELVANRDEAEGNVALVAIREEHEASLTDFVGGCEIQCLGVGRTEIGIEQVAPVLTQHIAGAPATFVVQVFAGEADGVELVR